MNFLSFQQTFENMPVIPVVEVEKYFPGFDRNNLVRWQEKGYLEKVRNGFYRLQKQQLTQDVLFLVAGKIYAPSYVSLESALSFYGLIPESVFTITSVSILKTRTFETPIGRFDYRNLKKDLFFGARLERAGNYAYKIADPVKALLDLLYLRTDIRNKNHLEGLRLNLQALKAYLEEYPLEPYLDRFDSKPLCEKVTVLQKMVESC
jgi:predicted transcriptional regulator of viral defense system